MYSRLFLFTRCVKQNLLFSACCWHRYRKAKIDCLSFVYVPATSAAHNRLLFFFFLLRLFTVLMKKTRAFKQSIFLRCLWLLNIKSRTWYTLPKFGGGRATIKNWEYGTSLRWNTTVSGRFVGRHDTHHNDTQHNYKVLICETQH